MVHVHLCALAYPVGMSCVRLISRDQLMDQQAIPSAVKSWELKLVVHLSWAFASAVCSGWTAAWLSFCPGLTNDNGPEPCSIVYSGST